MTTLISNNPVAPSPTHGGGASFLGGVQQVQGLSSAWKKGDTLPPAGQLAKSRTIQYRPSLLSPSSNSEDFAMHLSRSRHPLTTTAVSFLSSHIIHTQLQQNPTGASPPIISVRLAEVNPLAPILDSKKVEKALWNALIPYFSEGREKRKEIEVELPLPSLVIHEALMELGANELHPTYLLKRRGMYEAFGVAEVGVAGRIYSRWVEGMAAYFDIEKKERKDESGNDLNGSWRKARNECASGELVVEELANGGVLGEVKTTSKGEKQLRVFTQNADAFSDFADTDHLEVSIISLVHYLFLSDPALERIGLVLEEKMKVALTEKFGSIDSSLGKILQDGKEAGELLCEREVFFQEVI